MKKTALVIFSIAALTILTSGNYTDTGKVGYCGSPGEGTCQSCHSTNQPNIMAVPSVQWGQSWNGGTYTPGDVYNISLEINNPNNGVIGGFAVQMLDSLGNDAGQLQIKYPQYTELRAGTNNRTTIVHKSGYVSPTPGLVIYEFQWIVPAYDIGTVTMYMSAVGADGDGTTANDFCTTWSITYNYTTGPLTNNIADVNQIERLTDYKFYDLQGHLVATDHNELRTLPKAIYIVDSCEVRKKIMN